MYTLLIDLLTVRLRFSVMVKERDREKKKWTWPAMLREVSRRLSSVQGSLTLTVCLNQY